MQNLIALAIVAAAAFWLARHLRRRLAAAPCQPPGSNPPGSDGFVPLDQLRPPKRR